MVQLIARVGNNIEGLLNNANVGQHASMQPRGQPFAQANLIPYAIPV
jgi:hypothetical protein